MLRTVVTAVSMCAYAAAGGAQEPPREVTVFAAASLTNALEEVGEAFEAASGVRVRFSFAGSSLLARQIEAGAAVDVFFSADGEWMDYLDKRKLIRADTRQDVLSNRLVLIAPRDSSAAIKIAPKFPLARSLGDGRLALADPGTVPAGKYARAALTTLGVWEVVLPKVVPAENVRVALAYVARGEAALGIVYETDAKVERKVRVVDVFPADTHPPIVYPAALTASAKSVEARVLLAYFTADNAAAVFRRHGFRLATTAR